MRIFILPLSAYLVTPQKYGHFRKVCCPQMFIKHFFLHLLCRFRKCNGHLWICLDPGDPSWLGQPILPEFGGFFGLCTTGPPNRAKEWIFWNRPHITQYMDYPKTIVRALVHFITLLTISALLCIGSIVLLENASKYIAKISPKFHGQVWIGLVFETFFLLQFLGLD